jgi:hypothetical protein
MRSMRWNKLGLVWNTDGHQSWARTHAMVPTPILLDAETVRVFINCLDEKGRGRPGYVDVSARDPRKVIAVGQDPLLDVGRPGTFDDNGLLMTCVVSPGPGKLYMVYGGFELCRQVRYRIMTGVALSTDSGKSFRRCSEAPVLDRSDEGLYFRGAPFAIYDEGLYKLWYAAGSQWTEIGGKSMPVYELKYQESKDILHWGPQGSLSLPLGEDDHGIGRPYVVKRGPRDYQLFCGIRRRSLGAYRMGYAESEDGKTWTRRDEALGLDVSQADFDAKAITYPGIISVHGRTLCFYNGDNFGERGFAVAELLE